MRIRLPIMIHDPKLAGYARLKRIAERPYIAEDGLTDGPACARVAVRDAAPISGALRPSVPFVPPPGGRKLGRYQLADEKDIYTPDFIAVSVFGTVLRTIHMFEEPDTLGRPLTWAFDEPQLLIAPRAGEKANASYSRETRSLKFYYFTNPHDPAHKVYTALSRDIVCHETGHAILDGIAPHLLYASLADAPQAFALHESVADLVAVVMSFRSGNLREAILNETGGRIDDVSAFSSIGEEFGQALNNLDCLRDLRTPMRIDQVKPGDGYGLSQVLSAALYKMIIGLHERWWQKLSGEGAALNFSLSGMALGIAVEHFKRMIFRALDYLPPADVSFADYGRAIIAADQASHPDDEEERDFIRQEFTDRNIVKCPEALDVKTDYEHPAVKNLDLEALVRDDSAAHDFADRNRDLLHIPAGTDFTVQPRLDVTKLYRHRGGRKQRVRECLFKVRWTQSEPTALGGEREISVGTTLAIDWKTRRVRAVLTTDPCARPAEADSQRSARDAVQRRLVQMGVVGREAASEAQIGLSDGILGEPSAARMLRFAAGA